MASSSLHSLFRISRTSRKPPVEDIEQVLASYMAIPQKEPGSDQIPVISDASFRTIAIYLAMSTNPHVASHGKERPRIYTILHHISRTDVFPSFIEEGLTDFMLPMPVEDLPKSLGDDKAEFLRVQIHCLTDAKELFKDEDGQHVVLENADSILRSLSELGSGGFGHVDIVWSRLSLERYARKRISRGVSARETKKKFEFFEREIGALKKLHHKHLVKIRGTYTDRSCFAFLMVPVADCDLEVYLENMRTDRQPTLRSFFGCLASALTYLHREQIHHNDLKPRNILIRGNCVYLADFGAAHDWSARERSTTWSSQPHTTWYMPPERDGNPNAPTNYATDIWSLGVVYLEMLTVLRGLRTRDLREYLSQKGKQNAYPYKNIRGLILWLEKLRLQPGPDYDNIPQSWVKDMLLKDPTSRPYPKQLRSEILQAGYFSGFCCSVLEPGDDLGGNPEPEEDTHHMSYWDYDEDNDPEENLEATPLDTPKALSIQRWINRTEVIDANLRSATHEPGTLQFEIEDEEEDTILPLGGRDDESNPRFQELGSFNFFAGFESPSCQSTNDELTFDIENSSSDTSASEITLDLEGSTDCLDLEALQRHIDDDGHSPDLDAQLPVIEEECRVDEAESHCEPLPEEVPSHKPVIEAISLSNDFVIIEKSATDEPNQDPQPDDVTDTAARAPAQEPEDNLPSEEDVQKQPVFEEAPETGRERHVTFANDLCSHPKAAKSIFTTQEEITQQPQSTLTAQVRQEQTPPTPEQPLEAEQNEQAESAGSQASTAPRARRASLTHENLESLVSGSLPNKQAQAHRHSKGSHISARKYIRSVSVETASEATSVMSEGAKRKIQGLSISVWMSKGTPLLESYVSLGKVAVVRALLEAGCKPNGKGPLFAAVRGKSMKHVKCAEALLRKKAKVDVQSPTGKTALSMAIENPYYDGYKLLVVTLLRYGADPNVKDKNGDSPLLQILGAGYQPLEKHRRETLALIFANSQYPVDVNVKALGTQNTPLHLAVRRKDEYATAMLLDHGANTSMRNGAGQTAFALAVIGWSSRISNQQLEVTRLLVKAGADVNEQLGPSKSPVLHTAISHGLVDIVRILIRARANPERRDNKDQNAFKICTDSLAQGKINEETAEQITSWLTTDTNNQDLQSETESSTSSK